jgi:PASTA domain-containing protein/PKD domain-containing protein
MSRARILLFLLLVSAPMVASAAQAKAPPPGSKAVRVSPAALQLPPQFTATMSTATVAPPVVLKMPNLLWMEAREAAADVIERLHNKPNVQGEGIVVAQDPPPGGDVTPRTRISLTLGLPALKLSASTATPNLNDDVTFTLTFDPPPPSPQRIAYHFLWGDGSADTPVADATATHRFPEAGQYNVGSYAVIHDRWTVKGSGMALLPVAPAPTLTDSTPTATTQTQATETIATATETMPPGTIATEPPLTTSVTPPSGVPPAPDPIPWQWIAIAAAAIVILAAIIRAAIRKPRTPSVTMPPKVSIRSGLGSTEHTISNPERIRTGRTLRVRVGAGAPATVEGGPNV